MSPLNDRREILARVDLGALLCELTGIDSQHDQYPCPNPLHEQTGTTPPVSLGEDGTVWHCHGCDSGGSAVDALTLHHGWSVRDAFDELRRRTDHAVADPHGRHATPKAAEKPPEALPSPDQLDAWRTNLAGSPALLGRAFYRKGWTADALASHEVGWDGQRFVFPIRDALGDLLNVCRYVPDGKPKLRGLARRSRGLFPAPESFEGNTIWIVEGEPDAISLASAGIQAVAVPGASGWKAEWANRFAKRNVIVCCDCDGPGRRLSQSLRGDLEGVAAAVRVIDLEPERSDGYDVGDLIAEAAEDGEAGLASVRGVLQAMASGFTEPPDEARSASREAQAVCPFGPFKLVDLAGLIAAGPKAPEWRVDGLVADSTVTVLAAESGIGKSMLMQALCAAVANGHSVAGLHVKRGKALYVDREMGAEMFASRAASMGATGPLPYGYVDATGANLSRKEDLAHLLALILDTGANFVVLDSLSQLTPGVDENDNGHMGAVMTGIRDLSRKAGSAIVVIHHKSGKAESAWRGATSIKDQADALFKLSPVADGSVLKLTCRGGGKMRYAPEGEAVFLSIDLESGGVREAQPVDDDEVDRSPARTKVKAQALEVLANAAGPMSRRALAHAIGLKSDNQTVARALEELSNDGLVHKGEAGWVMLTRTADPDDPGGSGQVVPLGRDPRDPPRYLNPCRCVDGGQGRPDGRCERCFGHREIAA